MNEIAGGVLSCEEETVSRKLQGSGTWSDRRLNNFPKVLQQISGRTMIQIHIYL